MKKIAIALSKGGVGKTTTAVNLADSLARDGARVLLLDMDTQGQVAKALGITAEYSLADFLLGEATFERARIEARKNLWLLAGGRSMAGLKRLITRKDFGGEQTLTDGLKDYDHSYDYIILDTAPGWDSLTVNALFYVDEILAPVSLEIMTLQGLMDFSQSLISIQKYHPDLELRYILPTFFDRRVKKSAEIGAMLVQHFGKKICTPIRYNVRLSEAPGFGQTIFEYAPQSTGAEDYHSLKERIIQDGRA